MKLEFSWLNFEKYYHIKFHENPSSGSRFILYKRTDGLTNVRGEGNTLFPQFCKLVENWRCCRANNNPYLIFYFNFLKSLYRAFYFCAYSKTTNVIFWEFINILQLLHVSTYVHHHKGAFFHVSCWVTLKMRWFYNRHESVYPFSGSNW
jgi:hypothetical protein